MRRMAGLLGLLCLGAAVEAQEIRGGYVGAALGYFSYEEGGENLGAPLSESASAYRVVGGYQFNSLYALEAAWGRSSTFSERFAGIDPGVGSVSLELGGEYEIRTLRFVAFAPLQRFGMFGGAGYYDAKLDASFRYQTPGEVLTMSAEDSDAGLTLVGGMQYELERVALRGEYEWFDTDDGVAAQSLNLTAILRF